MDRAAWQEYAAASRPTRVEDFGMAVTEDGRAHVWLHIPDAVVGSAPARQRVRQPKGTAR
ncbi:hypothetical protein ADK86_27405 [Streptomyces sp. NRRL F-5755]|nr:hypothetical protein ADK86_27405 [Streptomyces sp. NRRL F-5755]